MIYIGGKPFETAQLADSYPRDGVESTILATLSSSAHRYDYDTLGALKFELDLRREIVKAARALYKSNLPFKVFRDSKCNPEYWIRQSDGGFELRPDVKASDAVRDIFENTSKYGTECATAMVIVYLKALLEVFPEEAFNRMFKGVYLMNWHRLGPELYATGLMHRAPDYLPGDRRYFANPDVNPKTPEWQGENVIDLDGGLYYGHGIGLHKASVFISALNRNRVRDATREAYLMDAAGRPDFDMLYRQYRQAVSAAGRPAA